MNVLEGMGEGFFIVKLEMALYVLFEVLRNIIFTAACAKTLDIGSKHTKQEKMRVPPPRPHPGMVISETVIKRGG